MAWKARTRDRAAVVLAIAWATALAALALGATGILTGGTPLGILAAAWATHAGLATAGLVPRPWMRGGA